MKKIISLVIIGVLLLGVLSASATIGERNKTVSVPIEDKTTGVSVYEDELDQFQLNQTDAIPVGAISIPDPPTDLNIQVAQSFIPKTEILTRVELLVGKNATASYPYVLAIREELTEENIVETSVNPEEFEAENFSWLEFDFDDILVTVGQTYYIVCYTENVTGNRYAWAANNDSESYIDGCAWASIDDGNTWTNDSYSAENMVKHQNGVAPIGEDDNASDMCFKTYGIKGTELAIEINKMGIGFSANITNVGNATAWEVEYSINVVGGLFGMINKTVSGETPELAVNDSIIISSGFFFGLGAIHITITARALNAPEVSVSADGVLFIIFVIIR